MIRVLTSEMYEEVLTLFESARESITIVSPFLSNSTAQMLINAKRESPHIECKVITRVYYADFLCGANSIEAIKRLVEAGIEVYAVKGLHSKLYLFDGKQSIVGSANFTVTGLSKNIELSLITDEQEIVSSLVDFCCEIETQCTVQNEGTIDSELVENIYNDYQSFKRRYNAGAVQNSTKMYGAELKAGGNISKFFLKDDQTRIISRQGLPVDDVVHIMLSDEEEEEAIDPRLKVLIKFEGKEFKGSDHVEVPQVELRGRKKCVLNFSKRPISIDRDMPFVLTRGFKDGEGQTVHVIVGRGTVLKFDPANEVLPKWIDSYEWMRKHRYYTVIKDIKVIDTAIENGIPLDELVQELGGDFYTTTAGKDMSLGKIHQHIARRSYLYITPIAKNMIDKRLDCLFDKYGAISFASQ